MLSLFILLNSSWVQNSKGDMVHVEVTLCLSASSRISSPVMTTLTVFVVMSLSFSLRVYICAWPNRSAGMIVMATSAKMMIVNVLFMDCHFLVSQH